MKRQVEIGESRNAEILYRPPGGAIMSYIDEVKKDIADAEMETYPFRRDFYYEVKKRWKNIPSLFY